jgi:hypothetical protein
MTSHDREPMNRLVSRIAEIDAGEIIVGQPESAGIVQ